MFTLSTFLGCMLLAEDKGSLYKELFFCISFTFPLSEAEAPANLFIEFRFIPDLYISSMLLCINDNLFLLFKSFSKTLFFWNYREPLR